MFLRKRGGGATIGDVEWPDDGAVAEVPDELGAELLAAAPDEFTEVEHADDTPTKRGPGRPKKASTDTEG